MSSGLVLIADDSLVARELVGRELRNHGYEVLQADNGAEALRAACERTPDVILLDVEMPVLDGFGALAELRRHTLTAEVPVVFLTGIEDSATAARCLAAGAHDYLRKPFDSVELRARVGAAQRTKLLQDELRRRNAQLAELACTDPLTGLRNRRHAIEELERLASRGRRHDRPLSTVLLDVDHFKSINDTHGHAAGDSVLCQLAARLTGRLRSEDLLARWGGEEFLIVLPDVAPEGAAAVAEALRELTAAAPFKLERGVVGITISVGWATWGGEHPDALIRRADEALYAAKAAGRNASRGHRPDLGSALSSR